MDNLIVSKLMFIMLAIALTTLVGCADDSGTQTLSPVQSWLQSVQKGDEMPQDMQDLSQGYLSNDAVDGQCVHRFYFYEGSLDNPLYFYDVLRECGSMVVYDKIDRMAQ